MKLDKVTQQYLELVKNRPVVFGIENGFTLLQDIHNEWLKLFLLSRNDVTLQAHRGSYKTTCLSIAIALIIVVKPTLNIIFIRKSDDDVKEIVVQVAKLLKTESFQELSMALWGMPCTLTKESAYEIDTNLKQSTKGSPQLIGIGSKSSMTGKHGDLIITDDIINVDDRISKAHRERTKMVYQELQNIKNRGGRIINTGTPWHKEDAFKLMPNIQTYDCYSTGLIDDKTLQGIRDSMTASLFAANYELKHIADSDAMFRDSRVDDGTNTHLIYNGVCHVDGSYGGSDGTAFTILKEQPDGTIYVYGELKQKHVDDCLAGFEEKRKHYMAGTFYNETNADKGYLNKKISAPKKPYHEKMNKYIKISTYLKSNWSRIVFIKETDKEYISQILDYTENAEHDDAPDSLASLIREAISKNNKVKSLDKNLLGI
jgi:hypothetical protein